MLTTMVTRPVRPEHVEGRLLWNKLLRSGILSQGLREPGRQLLGYRPETPRAYRPCVGRARVGTRYLNSSRPESPNWSQAWASNGLVEGILVRMGTLYIVGTPIGNLEDLTRRAVRVLGQVSLVAAEDTRVTRKLLSHLSIHAPLVSYHARNWRSRLPSIVDALHSGDVALVTDAGMPVVSDPGSELVSAARASENRVEVVPGPSAVTAALAVSGLPGDSFFFLGFLPRRGKPRTLILQSAAAFAAPHAATVIIFEAPHRLRATLQDLFTVLGDRELAVCRELTKIHEEVFRGSVSQALDYFTEPRGEFVLLLAGSDPPSGPVAPSQPHLETASAELAKLKQSGVRARAAVAQVAADYALPRKIVYQLWLQTTV